jgi:hypothetical protein
MKGTTGISTHHNNLLSSTGEHMHAVVKDSCSLLQTKFRSYHPTCSQNPGLPFILVFIGKLAAMPHSGIHLTFDDQFVLCSTQLQLKNSSHNSGCES